MIDVPASFTDVELEQARLLADPALAEAITASVLAGDRGLLTQYLAGAPDLMRHWQDAGADPYGRALITAAMDYARLAGTPDCPPRFLREAITGYLTDGLRTRAADDWIDAAFRYAAAPLRGTVSCLRPVPPEHGTGTAGYELADYLDQHSRQARATAALPASFWEAAIGLPLGIQATLADAAQARGYLRPAAQLLKNTLSTHPYGARDLFMLLMDVDPDRELYGDWIARRAPLADPLSTGLLLGAFLDFDADNAAETLIGRNLAANADLSDDPDTGILADELDHAGAYEQIDILMSRDEAHETVQPADPGPDRELDLNDLYDLEEIDRTDPAEVAYRLQIMVDDGMPDPVTSLMGPDLPPDLMLDYPESVFELLRSLEHAGARRHVQTLAERTAATAGLLTSPELSGRVLSILLKVGASKQVTQLMRHGPASLAELPRGSPASWTRSGKRKQATRSPRCSRETPPSTPF